jgi:hypothetical protein
MDERIYRVGICAGVRKKTWSTALKYTITHFYQNQQGETTRRGGFQLNSFWREFDRKEKDFPPEQMQADR